MFAPLFVYSYLTATVASAKAHARNEPRSERGASFTEYVVLIGAIVVVVAAGATLLGTKITAKVTALSL